MTAKIRLLRHTTPGRLLSEIGAEPGSPLLEFGQLGPQAPSVPPEAAERRAQPVTCAGVRGRNPEPGASRSRAQGWRVLIAGSLQHDAPLGHEVEEFGGG